MTTDELMAQALESILPTRKRPGQLLPDASRDPGGQLLDSVSAPPEERIIDREIVARRSAPDPASFPMPAVPIRDNRAEQSGAVGEIAAALLSSALLGARNPAQAAARYGVGRQKGLDANRTDALRDFQNEAVQSDADWRRANQEFQGNFRVDAAVDRLEEAEKSRQARLQLQRERDEARSAGDEATAQLKQAQLDLAREREERLKKADADQPYLEKLRALNRELDDPRTNEERRLYVLDEIARISVEKFGMGETTEDGRAKTGPPATKVPTASERAANDDRDAERARKKAEDEESNRHTREMEAIARRNASTAEGRLKADKERQAETRRHNQKMETLAAKPKAAAAPKPIDTAGDLGKLQKFDEGIEAKRTKIAQLKAGRLVDNVINGKKFGTRQAPPTARDLAEIQGLENEIKTQQSAKAKVATALGYKWDMNTGQYVFVGRTQTLPDGSTVTIKKK
jgi:hypothetical protein